MLHHVKNGRQHIPKGDMCLACTRLHDYCATYPFEDYKPMEKPDTDGYVTVKCEYFKHVSKFRR